MNVIGLIDDRVDVLETTSNAIKVLLYEEYEGWDLISSQPFSELDEYRTWIIENNLGVVIVDQKLNEKKINGKDYSIFLGNEVISYIRENFKDLPLFGLTTFSVTAMDNVKPIAYDIIERSKFEPNIEFFVRMFVKSGDNYYKLNRNKLERLSQLAENIALGKSTEDEKNEAKGLQTDLILPHYSENIIDRETYLSEIDESLKKFAELKIDIEKYLKG